MTIAAGLDAYFRASASSAGVRLRECGRARAPGCRRPGKPRSRMTFEIEIGGRSRRVAIEPAGGDALPGRDRRRGACRRRGAGRTVRVVPARRRGRRPQPLRRGGRRVQAARAWSGWTASQRSRSSTAAGLAATGATPPATTEGAQSIVAPMPGRVVRILVAPGDEVAARQPVVVVEAMKMENELRSPKAGRVKDVRGHRRHLGRRRPRADRRRVGSVYRMVDQREDPPAPPAEEPPPGEPALDSAVEPGPAVRAAASDRFFAHSAGRRGGRRDRRRAVHDGLHDRPGPLAAEAGRDGRHQVHRAPDAHRTAVGAAHAGRVRGREPGHRGADAAGPSLPHRQDDHRRGALVDDLQQEADCRVGCHDRLEHGGRDLRQRPPQLPEVHAARRPARDRAASPRRCGASSRCAARSLTRITCTRGAPSAANLNVQLYRAAGRDRRTWAGPASRTAR